MNIPQYIVTTSRHAHGWLSVVNVMTTALAVSLAFGVTSSSHAQAPTVVTTSVASGPPAGKYVRATDIQASLQKLAEGVYAYIQLPGAGQPHASVANAGVIVGNKGLTAVDALAAPLQTKALVAAAEKVTGKKFERAIITHQHFDHIFGLQFLGKVTVVSQQETRAEMLKTDTTKGLVDLWSEQALWATGKEKFTPVMPDTTYKDQLSYFEGAREIRLIYPGVGHTEGDTMVYLPKEKILFAGDLAFFGVAPMGIHGHFAEWIKDLDYILTMDVEKIVPGHGPVGTKDDIRNLRGYIELVYGQAKQLYAASVPLAEAITKINLGAYAQMPEVGYRTRLNVTRMYAEFSGN